MKRASTALVVMLLAVLVAGIVPAVADFNDTFHGRVAQQQARIDNGVRRGELSQSEAQVLQDNLNWIKGEELRLRDRGPLTDRDRRRILKMLDDNSKMIKDKRHNYKRLY